MYRSVAFVCIAWVTHRHCVPCRLTFDALQLSFVLQIDLSHECEDIVTRFINFYTYVKIEYLILLAWWRNKFIRMQLMRWCHYECHHSVGSIIVFLLPFFLNPFEPFQIPLQQLSSSVRITWLSLCVCVFE